MAFYLTNIVKSENNYVTGIPDILGHYECDTVSDLPAQSQGTYNLSIGCTAHVIENNSKYEINSSGVWVLQESIDSVYTKTEIDTMIDNAEMYYFRLGSKIEPGDDINGDRYTHLGHYYVASNADAANISSLPTTYGGRLEVLATIDNSAYVKQMYYCNDDAGLIYTRRKLSAGWSDWILLTPLNVCFSVGSQITASSDLRFDLNTLQSIGRHYYGGSAAPFLDNAPSDMSTSWGGEIIIDRIQLTNRYRQTIILNSNTHAGKRWERIAYSGTAPNLSWSSWYRFEGVQV